jgi:hypothetical protein
MTPSHDDPRPDFESRIANAQTPTAKAEGAQNAERPPETNPNRDRADGAGCHEADAGNTSSDAWGDAEEKEAGEEITEAMTQSGLSVLEESGRLIEGPLLSDSFLVQRIFLAMRRAAEIQLRRKISPFGSPTLHTE